jgi:hypothetical protein
MVAIAVALALPVSQLRAASLASACCCPDPARCQCPDHQADPSSPPALRACHDTDPVIAAPGLPAFSPPAVAAVVAPVAAIVAIDHALAAPHPAPPPRRPDAPS